RTVQNASAPPCPSVCSDFGWKIYPAGLREMLTIVGALGVPVYITENGIADAGDTLRGQYIYDHLATLQQAIADDVADVRGYFHWSLTDNFEWASGYYPKFGLASFDPTTGQRALRKSARAVEQPVRRGDGVDDAALQRLARRVRTRVEDRLGVPARRDGGLRQHDRPGGQHEPDRDLVQMQAERAVGRDAQVTGEREHRA